MKSQARRSLCNLNISRIKSSRNRAIWSYYTNPLNRNRKVDIKKLGMFKDRTFSATEMSLFWKNYLKNDYMIYDYEGIKKWVRPTQLVKNTRPSLWGDKGVLPASVVQGKLGDCWFLAAAAALAEYPERVKKIFYNKVYSSKGIFMVKLWRKGRYTRLIVDDRIPIRWDVDWEPSSEDDYSRILVNSSPSSNKGWWLVILEKAYAKFYVNYSNLEGGMPVQSFRDLTGMPVVYYLLQNQKDEELF